uniref:Receptor protein-tyrosine kinase n=1 Tax=Syphacia muris TaxID=451379 RepID=A0A158R642_9BILA
MGHFYRFESGGQNLYGEEEHSKRKKRGANVQSEGGGNNIPVLLAMYRWLVVLCLFTAATPSACTASRPSLASIAYGGRIHRNYIINNFNDDNDRTVPAIRVIRLKIDYPNASISSINDYATWNILMKNSVLASLRFINKHWLLCGETPYKKEVNDCGKLEVTGEVLGPTHYRINATFIAQRDPVSSAKVGATSTVFALLQIGLRGGIFQYTNELKILGKPDVKLNFDEEFFCFRGSILVGEDRCSKFNVFEAQCIPGTRYDHRIKRCVRCPKGSYQPLYGQERCVRCGIGFTTLRDGHVDKHSCIVECQPGYFLETRLSQCLPCGYTAYQPYRDSSICYSCPPGTITLTPTAVSITQCKSNCPPGEERTADGNCTPCRVGFFKTEDDLFCRPCNPTVTTSTTGAVSESQCNLTNCKPGFYFNQHFHLCLRCGYGEYQDDNGALQCKKCPAGYTTKIFGAKSISDCKSMNQCETGEHRCHWLAACFDLPDEGNQPRYGCRCQPGFVGNGFECTDICLHLCLNGGKCIKTSRGFPKCICPPNFEGKRCELNFNKKEENEIVVRE